MGLQQFINTCTQVVSAERGATVTGLSRHLKWQLRRALGMFPMVLEISKSRVAVDRPSGVAALINCLGLYDFNNMSLLQRVLRPGSIFFDVGANIGAYTLIASEHAQVRVFSFEPNPRACAQLRQNVELNRRGNVVIVPLAVGDQVGPVRMTDGADLSTNRVVSSAVANVESIEVPCQKLDLFCREFSVHPSAVKIDVEGTEIDVLRGFRDEHFQTDLFLIERGERAEIHSLMAGWGYNGPVYFHQRTGQFLRTRQARAEDTAYVSRASTLAMGIT